MQTVDYPFLSLVSVALTASLYLFLSACIPSSPMMICLLLSVHPFLIYYEYHIICPSGALPRNYTPFTLTRTCWSIYHTYQNASSTYDRIRCLLGVGAHPECTHTLNTHHTQTAKHFRYIWCSFLSLTHSPTHRYPCIDHRYYKSSLSWFSLPTSLAWLPWAQ